MSAAPEAGHGQADARVIGVQVPPVPAGRPTGRPTGPVDRPDAPPRAATHPPALSPVGLRAFFRIAALWRLSTREQAILLACSRDSVYRWRRHSERARLHRDRIERISTVLAIHAAVSSLVPGHALPGWLRDAGASLPWIGRAPLELMLDGNVSDLLGTLSLVEHLAAPAR